MQRFKTGDGLSLAYLDQGQGPAVLCLAGLTRDHHDFDEMAAHLPDVRLIRLDARGRGQSDWDPNPMNYSAPVEARDALELLDHLGLEKAAVIGTSRGGILAMLLAVMARKRLSGVLLNDVGPVIERPALELIVKFLGHNPAYRNYEEAAANYPDFCVGFANISPERWQVEVRRLWQETESGLKIRYDPALQVQAKASLDAPDAHMWPLFDAFAGLPLALLRGANSTLLSPETALEMQRRRPDMLFAEVPDRGHIPFLDEPESLDIIHKFLANLA